MEREDIVLGCADDREKTEYLRFADDMDRTHYLG